MIYLCLMYFDEAVAANAPPATLQSITEECDTYCDAMTQAGHLLASERLQPVRTAVTIRPHGGKPWLTDGPFAETREQLGGFFLIEARDLNEALRLAQQIPPGRLGCIEVRPVME